MHRRNYKSPLRHRKLSSVQEAPEEEERKQDQKGSAEDSNDGGGGDDFDDDGIRSTSTEGPDKWQPAEGPAETTACNGAAPVTGQENGGGGGGGRGGRGGEEAVKGHRRSGGKGGSTSSGTGAGEAGGRGGRAAGGHRGIQLVHLRKMTSKAIALKVRLCPPARRVIFYVPLSRVFGYE